MKSLTFKFDGRDKASVMIMPKEVVMLLLVGHNTLIIMDALSYLLMS